MQLKSPKRPGRPPGQKNSPGHKAGRPVSLTASEQKRYAHWLAWWPTRPERQPSAYALARRMEQPKSTVRAAANGDRPPSATLLANLESLSAAYGYVPRTSDNQFL